jgi:AraC family ethanolamine operon transcriptional activator
VSRRLTSDASEHAVSAPGWEMRFEQLSAGAFRGSLTEIALPHSLLLREQTNQVLAKSGRARAGMVVFNLPLAAEGSGRCAGRPLRFPDALLIDSPELPPLRTPATLDLISVALERDWLLELADTVKHVDLAPLLGGLHGIHLPQALRQRLCSAMQRLSEQVENLPAPGDAGLAELEQRLALEWIEAIAGAPHEAIVSPLQRKRVIDKARQFALHTPDTPPTIYDLCKRIGVSRRKLQNCFQEEFGVSPSQYLRAIRLNAVRRELLQRREEALRVGDVAARWGFWHLGRFASDYRALFGERPSETVIRPIG